MKLLRRIFLFTGSGLLVLALLFVLWWGYLIYNLDEIHQADRDFTDSLKIVESEFRTFYHGKINYPAYSFDQLREMGVLGDEDPESFKKYRVQFYPFSSATPDDAIVLRFHENWWDSCVFTKRDLIADFQAPDQIVP